MFVDIEVVVISFVSDIVQKFRKILNFPVFVAVNDLVGCVEGCL